MFLHAISPTRSFTKVPNALFRKTTLLAETRLFLAYVGGLPPADQYASICEHSKALGFKSGTAKKVKKELLEHGYAHDHRDQGARGLQYTEQWLSTVPLTEDEFTTLRTGQNPRSAPSVQKPTAGQPRVRRADRFTGTTKTNYRKTSPTRPPQDDAQAQTTAERAAEQRAVLVAWVEDCAAGQAAEPVEAVEAVPEPDPVAPAAAWPVVAAPVEPPPAASPLPTPEPVADEPPAPPPAVGPVAPGANTPQTEPEPDSDSEPRFALAERMLRELETVRRDLRMSVRNIRYLACNVADQLQRGVPAMEIYHALSHDLPKEPIRNAAGFVTNRLRTNVPDPAELAAADTARAGAAAAQAPAPPRPVVECRGPGRPGAHAFRPVGDETFCPACRREYPGLAELAEAEHEDGGVWAPLPALEYSGEPPF